MIFNDAQEKLLSNKNNCQLKTNFHVASTRSTFFLPISKDSGIFSWIANEYSISFKESNVENGSIVVDKVEDVDFQRQRIVKLGLGPIEFHFGQSNGKFFIDVTDQQNTYKINACSGGGNEYRCIAFDGIFCD